MREAHGTQISAQDARSPPSPPEAPFRVWTDGLNHLNVTAENQATLDASNVSATAEIYRPAYHVPRDLKSHWNNVIVRVDDEDSLDGEDPSRCTFDTAWWRCWRKTGFLGAKHLVSPHIHVVGAQGLLRPDWMANDVVQRKQIYNITFPGTVNSGAYNFVDEAGWSQQAQTLTIQEQLLLGVRAFDFKVAYNSEEQELYVSNMYLAVPLTEVVYAMRDYLKLYPTEVILVKARPDKRAALLDSYFTQPMLVEERKKSTKLPGQGVHMIVYEALKDSLATYWKLVNLTTKSRQNPTVAELRHVNVQVLYFWKDQQVLCMTMEECMKIPNWQPNTFEDKSARQMPHMGWQPVPLGERTPQNGSIEPACLTTSKENYFVSTALTAEAYIEGAKSFFTDPTVSATNSRPLCMPRCWDPESEDPILGAWPCPQVPPPPLKSAPLFYWSDADISANDVSPDFRFTAERLNYLLLWKLLGQNKRPSFTNLNVIAFNFIAPVLVHRLIEANLDTEDCAFSVVCRLDGSCFAMSNFNPNHKVKATCLDPKGTAISMIDLMTQRRLLKFLYVIANIFFLTVMCMPYMIYRRIRQWYGLKPAYESEAAAEEEDEALEAEVVTTPPAPEEAELPATS